MGGKWPSTGGRHQGEGSNHHRGGQQCIDHSQRLELSTTSPHSELRATSLPPRVGTAPASPRANAGLVIPTPVPTIPATTSMTRRILARCAAVAGVTIDDSSSKRGCKELHPRGAPTTGFDAAMSMPHTRSFVGAGLPVFIITDYSLYAVVKSLTAPFHNH